MAGAVRRCKQLRLRNRWRHWRRSRARRVPEGALVAVTRLPAGPPRVGASRRSTAAIDAGVAGAPRADRSERDTRRDVTGGEFGHRGGAGHGPILGTRPRWIGCVACQFPSNLSQSPACWVACFR